MVTQRYTCSPTQRNIQLHTNTASKFNVDKTKLISQLIVNIHKDVLLTIKCQKGGCSKEKALRINIGGEHFKTKTFTSGCLAIIVFEFNAVQIVYILVYLTTRKEMVLLLAG